MSLDSTSLLDQQTVLASSREVFDKAKYALAGLGFAPVGADEIRTPNFAIARPECVLEKDGVEVLPTFTGNGFSFQIVIPAPLSGPIAGFSAYEYAGRRMWVALRYVEPGDSITDFLPKLEVALSAAKAAIKSQPDIRLHTYYNFRVELEKNRIRMINSMMLTVHSIVMGALLGVLAGVQLGAQGCQAEVQTLEEYGIQALGERESAQLERVIALESVGAAIPPELNEVQIERNVLGGAAQGGVLGLIFSMIYKRRKKNPTF